MAGVVVSFTVVNAIVFSFIFWLITFLCKYFYSNKYYNYKLNFYECGFKSLTTSNINYNINFLILLLFLLIYDGEFLVLMPFSLNVQIANLLVYTIILFFLLWLIITLLLDYMYGALDWQA